MPVGSPPNIRTPAEIGVETRPSIRMNDLPSPLWVRSYIEIAISPGIGTPFT